MCYEFRLDRVQLYQHLVGYQSHNTIEIKPGRFDANWNFICGTPIPVFEQRRSVKGVATGEKTSLLSFFNVDHASNLCSILGYRYVFDYSTYFEYDSLRTVHIMHRQYRDPFWELYPDFACDTLSGMIALSCSSKSLFDSNVDGNLR